MLTSSPTLAKAPQREKRDRQTVLRVFLSVFGCENVCAHESGAHDWINSVQAGYKIPGAISSCR